MNIKEPQGDDIDLELFGLKDRDGDLILDFTGWEIWFTVKEDSSQADPGILQKTLSGGGIVALPGPAPEGARARFGITHTESKTLFQPGTAYVYDVQTRSPAPEGKITTVVKNKKIQLSADITKSS